MARWRFCWERRDEFVEQQHRAHHPWKNHDAEEEENILTFKTKVVFCMSTMKLLNKTFKVLLWSDAHMINETTPKQQSPRGALYPKLSYFLTTQQMSVKNWNISSTKIWCVLSHVFEFCCCIKLNVPESWNGNHGIYSIKQTMSFLKHREIFLDARRSASEGKLHTSLLQTNESWDFNI